MTLQLMRSVAEWNVQVSGLKSFIADNCTSETVMVEVGSYAGESAELFAAIVKELICVDPWNFVPDLLHGVEAEAHFDKLTAPFFNIVKVKGFSEDISRFFKPHSLDLVYIDANHDYDHVHADIFAWLPAIKVGGYIGGHDYSPTFPGVPRAVSELLGVPDKTYRDASWVKKVA